MASRKESAKDNVSGPFVSGPVPTLPETELITRHAPHSGSLLYQITTSTSRSRFAFTVAFQLTTAGETNSSASESDASLVSQSAPLGLGPATSAKRGFNFAISDLIVAQST